MATAAINTSTTDRPAANDLSCMIALGEEIKSVGKAASQINLTGINAILLAGRAGESARGFGVLSGQLREFTRGLAVSMDRLGMLIDGAVDAVSDHMRHRRLMSLLLCTADLDERCADLIAPALQSGAAATVRRLDRVTERREALRAAIDEARALGLTGSMLARTAKIEAAYGGGFRQEMTGVSGEFERTVSNIVASLGTLARLQREGQS
jgi:hypothetical protein